MNDVAVTFIILGASILVSFLLVTLISWNVASTAEAENRKEIEKELQETQDMAKRLLTPDTSLHPSNLYMNTMLSYSRAELMIEVRTSREYDGLIPFPSQWRRGGRKAAQKKQEEQKRKYLDSLGEVRDCLMKAFLYQAEIVACKPREFRRYWDVSKLCHEHDRLLEVFGLGTGLERSWKQQKRPEATTPCEGVGKLNRKA